MIIKFGYELSLSCTADTPVIVRVDIHPDRQRDIIHEDPAIQPGARHLTRFVDQYGNIARRFIAPSGTTTLTSIGFLTDGGWPDDADESAREMAIDELPTSVLPYLVASRYCETDLLAPIAWQKFGHLAPGYGRVRAICEFVHRHIAFNYNDARNTRTALQAYEERVGVCRDFTHLAIALCRSLNIPARYVNGYLGDIGVPQDPAPMDFSAWFEVFLGGRWYTFDARHNRRRIGRIVIARGLDAMDVPMIHTFGPHVLQRFRVITEQVPEADAYSLLASAQPARYLPPLQMSSHQPWRMAGLSPG